MLERGYAIGQATNSTRFVVLMILMLERPMCGLAFASAIVPTEARCVFKRYCFSAVLFTLLVVCASTVCRLLVVIEMGPCEPLPSAKV